MYCTVLCGGPVVTAIRRRHHDGQESATADGDRVAGLAVAGFKLRK